MKKTKLIFSALISSFLLFSCSPEEVPNKKKETSNQVVTENLNKIQEFSDNSHTVELLSAKQTISAGNNTVYLKIKDSKSNEYISPEKISWKATLNGKTCCGHDFKREAPTFGLKAVENNKTLLEGVIFFEKASDDAGTSWDLEIQFDHNGQPITIVDKIIVNPEKGNNKTVQCFKGEDKNLYTIAIMEPSTPKIGVNDMKVALFNADGTIADGYTILITTSMKMAHHSHGSPNNIDLTQSSSDKLYHGKVNFTMVGLWRINLQIVDKDGNTLKGEETDPKDNESISSVFFDIEFK